jgi:hypothetical protein
LRGADLPNTGVFGMGALIADYDMMFAGPEFT